MRKGFMGFLCTLLAVGVILYGCGSKNMKDAVFTNVKPSVTIDSREYIVSQNATDKDQIEKQIAVVTKVNNIVSYPDETNPYKNIGKIYKLKNENENNKVAVEINGILYIAEKESGD